VAALAVVRLVVVADVLVTACDSKEHPRLPTRRHYEESLAVVVDLGLHLEHRPCRLPSDRRLPFHQEHLPSEVDRPFHQEHLEDRRPLEVEEPHRPCLPEERQGVPYLL
jgi:hypothetical protein